MSGRRNKDVRFPTQKDCEPGCQDCYWELTCVGPPDLCPKCGLALPYSGFSAADEPMCTCMMDDPDSFVRWDSMPGPWPRRAYPRHSICVWPQLPNVYTEAWLDDLHRVGGDACCTVCGAEYRDHPGHPRWPTFGTLHVTCDGRPVKT